MPDSEAYVSGFLSGLKPKTPKLSWVCLWFGVWFKDSRIAFVQSKVSVKWNPAAVKLSINS